MSRHYDAIIIGAGMSGIAAGIRMAMFGKKVCIFERHTIAGGLNSFYSREGRKLDVGLHAMTNFAAKGSKGKPLTKLLKQLRIPYSDFKLNQQSHSLIKFENQTLRFTNDSNDFIADIELKFPEQKENIQTLLKIITEFDEVNLDNPYESAREKVNSIITDPLLSEMLFCPLLIYGSAWENDMDFSQFVIMFKSIFLEGFSRPEGGVRTLIRLIQKKYKDLGGEIEFRNGVQKIETSKGQVTAVVLDSGERVTTYKVMSSIGLPETYDITQEIPASRPAEGRLSFCETIVCFEKKPRDFGIDETIVFYNESDNYKYQKPSQLFDVSSAVICFPNNFEIDDYQDGMIRLTFMANYELWNDLDEAEYAQEKEKVLSSSVALVKKLYPQLTGDMIFHDVFTPKTIKKFTGHCAGTVYGSTEKSRDGKTAIDGLYVCGTDQGFLGIVGAMLSGISMANLHLLMPTENEV